MKVLVTGGAGFIGTALCARLADEGHSLIVLDDLSRGERGRLDAIPHEFIHGDVADEKDVEEAVARSDAVMHLAALSQVMPSIEKPKETMRSNAIGTYNIAQACSKFGKRLVFASSREVYGNPEKLPCDEGAKFKPENPYAASKICGESWIIAMQAKGKFDYSILRLANVYGRGDKGRVVPIFIQKAGEGREITVYGKGKIVDFVYVDDVVDAFMMALAKPTFCAVNIGSGKGMGLEELARAIISQMKSQSKIRVEGERGGEVDRYTADISLAKKVLGWKPKTPIEAGLGKACHGS